MDMIQDWMIINKIKMGDPDAWDILVHKYYDSVYFYCVRRCYGDCDIASDLTQDIFLKLVESLPRYRFIGKFQNYLYTMAVNTCNNYLKKRHIEQIELTDNFTTDLDTSLIDEILHDERKETVQKALDLLPEIQREVVILRYYHDLKVKDIATITGVGVSTVQSRIYQGLRKLEKVLERNFMMDKKDIISKLAGYKLEGDIEGREKTIELGYEIMIRLGMSRHSYFELFLSTFRFIHVHTWIIQLFIFLSGITMALNFKNLQPISEIMLCITGVIFISALFFLDELFKSFTTGMWELEQTFKYDLRQHIMMKLLIFGIIDMVIVILLSLMTKSIVSLPLYQILVYVLVPYNIVCIILFSLITIWRKQLHNYFLWCISGSICVAVILIANIFKIYEIRMLYWGIAYFITTTILGIILYSQTKIIKWEVASVWN